MAQTMSDNPHDSPKRDHLRTITGETFAHLVLEAVGPVVVEFMSYGCAHCRVIEPVLQQVAGLLSSEETFCRVNVAVAQDLAETYAIAGSPTLIMFSNGEIVGRSEGPSPTVAGVLAIVTKPFKA